MAATSVVSIKKHFAKLPDPRVRGRTRHQLVDIVVMAICGVIANCDDWRDIAVFARKREAWFRRFLALPGGVPAHDTFRRVFTALDPCAFERCCIGWLRAIAGLLGLQHIAIDGKTLCGSRGSTLGPLHLVSAWATQAHLTLGQVAVDSKSNEITAIPELLALLDLKGALVTIDAIGCQKAIAQAIVDGGGDYVLTVKGNQERLLDDICATVERALDGQLPAEVVHHYTTTERGHGRVEERSYLVIQDLEHIRDRDAWAGLTSVGMCYRERTVAGRTSTEVRYFIGSPQWKARKYGRMLRQHWGVENNLHWQLDISFDEDDSHIRERNAAENFALLRRLALGLLKQNAEKQSIARKRKQAALDTGFLEEILSGASKVEKV
jgi:predicted transposase YbfD/YdcC